VFECVSFCLNLFYFIHVHWFCLNLISLGCCWLWLVCFGIWLIWDDFIYVYWCWLVWFAFDRCCWMLIDFLNLVDFVWCWLVLFEFDGVVWIHYFCSDLIEVVWTWLIWFEIYCFLFDVDWLSVIWINDILFVKCCWFVWILLVLCGCDFV